MVVTKADLLDELRHEHPLLGDEVIFHVQLHCHRRQDGFSYVCRDFPDEHPDYDLRGGLMERIYLHHRLLVEGQDITDPNHIPTVLKMTDLIVRERQDGEVLDGLDQEPVYFLQGQIYQSVHLLAWATVDTECLKGKYLTNAFEGEPEDLTVEEMTTLEDQWDIIKHVRPLTYGKDCHPNFLVVLERCRDPKVLDDLSKAIQVVWALGFRQESIENDMFFDDWRLSEIQDPTMTPELLAAHQHIQDSIAAHHT